MWICQDNPFRLSTQTSTGGAADPPFGGASQIDSHLYAVWLGSSSAGKLACRCFRNHAKGFMCDCWCTLTVPMLQCWLCWAMRT